MTIKFTPKFTKTAFLLFAMVALFQTGYTQCTLVSQASPAGPAAGNLAVTPTCTNQATGAGQGVGSGGDRTYTGFTAGVNYNLQLAGVTSEFNCAQFVWRNSSNVNIGGYTAFLNTTVTSLAPSGADRIYVTAGRAAWTTTSANLNYAITTPNAATATASASTFCDGSTVTITGGGGGNGTLYWQNTTSGGTSTATTTNPQTVSATGTYYWRSINGGCPGTEGSAAVTELAAFARGTISSGDQTICNNGDPSNITFVTAPAGSGSFTYQWYFQDGLVTCPSGSSTAGWTLIGSATSSSYDPPSGLTTNRTYACFVTPGGTPTCGTAGWATSCRQVTVLPAISYGSLNNGNETICTGGDPANITFAGAPTGFTTFTYTWYFQDGLITCPTGGSTSGWTSTGVTTASYDPPSGLTTSRTYACLITPTGSPLCGTATWASNCRQVTVVADPAVTNPASGSVCAGGAYTMTVTGSGGTPSLSYAWEYSPNGTAWSAVANGTPAGVTYGSGASFTITTTDGTTPAGTYYYRVTVSATGSGCGTATSANTQTLTVAADPVAASITKSPNVATVCQGTAVSATIGSFSGGVSGTTTDVIEFSINGGGSWNTYTSGATISTTGLSGTNVVQIRTTRTSSGTDCESASNLATWSVDASPTINGPTSVCDASTANYTNTTGSTAWSSDAGSINTSGLFTPPNITPPTPTQSVNISVVNGVCTTVYPVVVYNNPTITSGSTSLCEADTRNLTSDVTGVTWSASPSPGSISVNVFTAPNPGGASANYTIFATNGSCQVFYTQTVFANASITSSSANMCEGTTRNLTANYGPGVFSGTGVSGTTFTAPTPAGNSQVYTINYQVIGSACAAATQNITVFRTPSTSNAGSNFSACGFTTNLAGNNPTFGTGTWTLDAGPGTAAYTNANANNTSVTVTAYGTYTFRWTITNGPCTSSSTTVQVTFDQPVTSNAGPNLAVCGTTGTLAGNNPAVGTGTWTLDAGPGTPTYGNANAFNSSISVTAYGTYTFRWTVVNGSCNATSTVSRTFDEPVSANAGPNIEQCNDPVFFMNASTPVVGTGIWTVLIGTGSVVAPGTSPNNEINSVPSNTAATVRWTVTNGACSATDDAIITNWGAPSIADAGSDVVACASLNATLGAVSPAVGTGTWTQTAGFGSSTYSPNANTNNATVTNTNYGVFTYTWTITNGTCPSNSDDVDVVFDSPISFTAIKDDCISSVALNDSDYVFLQAAGGSSPFTFTDVTGTGEQKVVVSNAQRVFSAPMTGAAHNYSVSDLWGCTQTTSITTSPTHPIDIPYSSSTGSLTADCYVSYFNNWTTFRDASNQAILSINDLDQDLGQVSVTVYKDALTPIILNSSDSACAGTPTTAMQRHFVITSTVAPVNKVGVRLYFTNTELDSLINASTSNDVFGNRCTGDDNITNINELYVTKYSGLLEDGDYNNNSAAGVYRVFGDDNPSLPGTPNGALSKFSNGMSTLFSGAAPNHYVYFEPSEFSEIWLNGSLHNTPLPVELIYFEANPINNSYIELKWSTALEIDNDGFEIERSTDGVNFTRIAWENGNDNSTTIQNYKYNDYNVEPNRRYYYRLKQVDNDGDFAYTPIVSGIIGGELTMSVKDFIPNPTTGISSLIITSVVDQHNVTIEIYNLLGERVLNQNTTLIRGGNKVDFDLNTLAGGTYTAIVSSANEVYSRKLVITK